MLWVIRSENEHECNISKHLIDQIVLTYGRIIISMHNMLMFSRLWSIIFQRLGAQYFSSSGKDKRVKLRKQLNMLSRLGWIKWCCNLNMCGSSFMCIQDQEKFFVPQDVTFVIEEWRYKTSCGSFSCLANCAYEWLIFSVALLTPFSLISPSFCSSNHDILDSPCAPVIVLRVFPWRSLSWRGLMEIYSPSSMKWV
jgi:hypothetical protein